MLAFDGEISIEPWMLETASRKVLRGVVTEASQAANRPAVLIVPGLCQTLVGYGPLARYLARLGFRVYRFDFTNHAGISDGEMFAARLSAFVDDINAATDFVTKVEGSCHVVASSLAARAAFRAFANRIGTPPASITGLLPVVNFASTVHHSVGQDLVSETLNGRCDGPTFDLWGYELDVAVIADAIAADMHTLASVIVDLDRLASPLTLIGGEEDDIIAPSDLAKAAASSRHPIDLMMLPALTHRSVTPPALRAIAQAIARHLLGDEPSSLDDALDCQNLSVRELRETMVFDREWLRRSFDAPALRPTKMHHVAGAR